MISLVKAPKVSLVKRPSCAPVSAAFAARYVKGGRNA